MKLIEKPLLPKEIAQTEAKPQLLAQAVRVYLANQRQGTQSALTRAEVNRTRRKYQKQKRSGHARHGDRKAPIFVGGGVAFAPKPRDYSLSFPKKMRQLALLAALSAKNKTKQLHVASGLDKLSGKTKEVAKFLAEIADKKPINPNWLIVTDGTRENVYRAARNIPHVEVLPVSQINTYTVLKAGNVLFMEEALAKFGGVKAPKPKVETKKTPAKKTVRKVTKKT